jgi:hypothetical protein
MPSARLFIKDKDTTRTATAKEPGVCELLRGKMEEFTNSEKGIAKSF